MRVLSKEELEDKGWQFSHVNGGGFQALKSDNGKQNGSNAKTLLSLRVKLTHIESELNLKLKLK